MPKKKQDQRNRTPLERLEVGALEAIGPFLKAAPVKAVGAIGEVGDQPPLLALSAATFGVGWLRGDPRLVRTGTRMIAAHLLATAAKSLGKNNVDRSRPEGVIEGEDYQRKKGSSPDPALRSFPSGHTAGAFALAGAVAREYPEHRLSALVAAGTIGALQLPRRAHFPSDVVAGAAIGLLAEILVDRVTKALQAPVEAAARREHARESADDAA